MLHLVKNELVITFVNMGTGRWEPNCASLVLDFSGPVLNVGPGWQYAHTDQILSAIGSCLVQIVKMIQKDSSPMVKIATFLCPNIKHFFQTYCQFKTPNFLFSPSLIYPFYEFYL